LIGTFLVVFSRWAGNHGRRFARGKAIRDRM
jgi:hypothetical protein